MDNAFILEQYCSAKVRRLDHGNIFSVWYCDQLANTQHLLPEQELRSLLQLLFSSKLHCKLLWGATHHSISVPLQKHNVLHAFFLLCFQLGRLGASLVFFEAVSSLLCLFVLLAHHAHHRVVSVIRAALTTADHLDILTLALANNFFLFLFRLF